MNAVLDREAVKEEVILTPIYSNKFKFSNYLVDCINGKVWSKKNNRFLDVNPNSNGYVYCSLMDDNGDWHSYGVHRLVLCSHSGIPLEMFCRGGIEVDHIKEDQKWNNRLDNLQMCTRKGQYKESTRAKMGKGIRLKEEEVCEILADLDEWLEDEDNKISDFIHLTAEVYGQSYRNVHRIVYGKSWKRLHNKKKDTNPTAIESVSAQCI